MPGLSTGIHIALQAVLTHSQAIEVIEHNVANASTPGYRRQAARLAASIPTPGYGPSLDHIAGVGQRGTGVLMDRIQRFSEDLLDTRYRAAAGEANRWEAQKNMLVRLETVLAETSGTGLLAKMDTFWSGWQHLAADPQNLSLRTSLLDDGRALAQAISSRAQEMVQIQVDQNKLLRTSVQEINEAAASIAELNGQIATTLSVGDQPNDLLDRRDMLIDRLSELTGAVSFPQANGEVIVNVGGHVLVAGGKSIPLEARVDPDPANTDGLYNIYFSDGQKLSPSSGELKGIFDARDRVIPERLAALNQLAASLIDRVNTIHRQGYGTNNAHDVPFFTGTDALSMERNKNLTEADIAAAAAADQPGDNNFADQIAQLRTSKVMSGGTQTFHEFYNNQVVTLATRVKQATSDSSHQSLLFRALGEQRESLTGVSLDEEAANLATYQKAYQAAARVMTVYDELLDKVINGMGIVGR